MNLKQKENGFVWRSGEVGEIVEVRVHYIKSASLSRRGIFVDVQPKTITPDNGTGWQGESFALFSGAQVMVERLARVKPSALAVQAARIDAHAPVFGQIMAEQGKEAAQLALKAFYEQGTVPSVTPVTDWSGSQCTEDPGNCWIDDITGEHVNALTAERTAQHVNQKETVPLGNDYAHNRLDG